MSIFGYSGELRRMLAERPSLPQWRYRPMYPTAECVCEEPCRYCKCEETE